MSKIVHQLVICCVKIVQALVKQDLPAALCLHFLQKGDDMNKTRMKIWDSKKQK